MQNSDGVPTDRDRFNRRAAIMAAIIGALLSGIPSWAAYFRERDRREETSEQALNLTNLLADRDKRLSDLTDKLESLRAQLEQMKVSPVKPEGIDQPLTPTTLPISPPPPPESASRSVAGLEVTLLNCVATGGSVDCALKVANNREDRHIRLWAESGSRLVDQDGNEVRAAAASLGTSQRTMWWAENDLVKDIPVRAVLFFEEVPEQARSLKLLEVAFGYRNDKFSAKFNDVPLQRD